MKQTSQYQAMKQEGILLNANESSVNLPLAIREEIAQAIQETAFNRYPQDDYTALREAYARYLQLQPEQIIAGNGSDEMLGLMIGLYIGKGKKLHLDVNDVFSHRDSFMFSVGIVIRKKHRQPGSIYRLFHFYGTHIMHTHIQHGI